MQQCAPAKERAKLYLSAFPENKAESGEELGRIAGEFASTYFTCGCCAAALKVGGGGAGSTPS